MKTIAILSLALSTLSLGCGDDAGPSDAGRPDAGDVDGGRPGVDAGTDAGTPELDAGAERTLLERARALRESFASVECGCGLEATGFASMEECLAFDRVEARIACEEAGLVDPDPESVASLECELDEFEPHVDCLADAACDEAAEAACWRALETAPECPEPSAESEEALRACIVEDVIGEDASACPENGTPSTATGDAVFTGSTLLAGDDRAGMCGGGDGPDRAYQWSAPASATYTIDTLGSDFDTVLYVHESCEGGAELGCSDDDGEEIGRFSRVRIRLDEGNTVLIVVDGFGDSAGDFQVNIREG